MQSLKILQYCPCVTGIGGVQRGAPMFANYFVNQNHKVWFATDDSLDISPTHPLDPKITRVQARGMKPLQQLIEEHQFDIVLSHAYWQLDVMENIGKITRKAGGRYILFFHTHYFRHLITFHQGSRFSLDIYSKLHELASEADALVVTTKQNASIFGIHLDNVIAIPNPTEVDNTPTRALKAKRIITAGRLDIPVKQVHLTVYAFAEILKTHPDATLTLVGGDFSHWHSPNERLSLPDLMASLGITEEQIEITGYVSNVDDYYTNASVYIHTASVEGWGRTLTEAGAHGLPRVAFHFSGIDSVIENGIDGFIIPQGDYKSLAAKVCELFDDESLLEHTGKAAMESTRLLGIDHVGREWLEMFDLLVNQPDQIKPTLRQRLDDYPYDKDDIIREALEHLQLTTKIVSENFWWRFGRSNSLERIIMLGRLCAQLTGTYHLLKPMVELARRIKNAR